MTSLKTLPDILILIFTNPILSIPDLLRCEQVNKLWYGLIRRNSDVRVWRARLVAGFPEGCAPARYGMENWRDVATSWWAWSRPWEPAEAKRLKGAKVEVLEVGETLSRTQDGVVSDLVFGDSQRTVGIQPDGQIVVKRTAHSAFAFLDTVFADTIVRAITDIASIPHIGGKALIRRSPPILDSFSYRLENWDTGNILARDRDLRVPTRFLKGIFSSHLEGIFEGGLLLPWKEPSVRFVPIDNSSQVIIHEDSQLSINAFSSFNTSSASNDCVLVRLGRLSHAYGTHDGTRFHYTLSVIRINDKRRVGYNKISCCTIDKIAVSKFNIFLSRRDHQHCVFDFHANHLYTLAIEPFWHDVYWRFNPSLEGDSWIVLTHESAEYLTVLDPRARTYQRQERPSGHRRSEESGRKEGYYFAVKEYSVDASGKRTGAEGRSRFFWKWTE
ncbi:hypothetical protein HDV00_012815 [Rhizophlyctis rosea]|nr:hypothetical protein HDV00_012815 [Rhizophlyctis rosea]